MKSVLPKTSVTRSVDLLTFTSGTMKSHGRDGFVTAQSVAIDCGHEKLVSPLESQIHHVIPAKKLETLESNVHNLMRKLTGAMVRAGHAVAQTCLYSLKIKKHAVRLPRLCVMMKIKGARPSLWVPIPDMYGVRYPLGPRWFLNRLSLQPNQGLCPGPRPNYLQFRDDANLKCFREGENDSQGYC